MPVLTSPPLLVGGTGIPVDGRIVIFPTEGYEWAGQFVTTAPKGGVIRGGAFYGEDGESPLQLMPTATHVGMCLELHIADYSGVRPRQHVIKRTVKVLEVESVDWSSLVDFVPPVPGEVPEEPVSAGFGLTPFGTGPFGM